jgi:hypothetical protein
MPSSARVQFEPRSSSPSICSSSSTATSMARVKLHSCGASQSMKGGRFEGKGDEQTRNVNDQKLRGRRRIKNALTHSLTQSTSHSTSHSLPPSTHPSIPPSLHQLTHTHLHRRRVMPRARHAHHLLPGDQIARHAAIVHALVYLPRQQTQRPAIHARRRARCERGTRGDVRRVHSGDGKQTR